MSLLQDEDAVRVVSSLLLVHHSIYQRNKKQTKPASLIFSSGFVKFELAILYTHSDHQRKIYPGLSY
jgi:hypothetical protein